MTHTKKDFLSMADLSAKDIEALLARAGQLKKSRRLLTALRGQTLGMIFQKPSTRTSVSFAVAMNELGGFSLALNAQDLQIRRGETMADTARTLSRYVHAIMIRANSHDDVIELAHHAHVPVINGLTDKEHPCQVLADLLTLQEVFRLKKISQGKNLKIAYVGDGNNMVHSWLLAAGLLGLRLVVACPAGYDPEKEFLEEAQDYAQRSGGRLSVVRDPAEAAAGAHVLYTDVWASMGKEEENDKRKVVFQPYQLNAALLARADSRAVVLHCLPAHRGEEITAEVLEGKQSVVFQQAENRLHVQKAVLLSCFGKK